MAASVWKHGLADRGAAGVSGVGEGCVVGGKIGKSGGGGQKGVGGIRREGLSCRPRNPREKQDSPLGQGPGIQEQRMSYGGYKTHPLGYADAGRKAKILVAIPDNRADNTLRSFLGVARKTEDMRHVCFGFEQAWR